MFSPRLREERAYSSLDKLQMHCPIDIVRSSCVSLSCCCIQSIVGAKNAKVQKYKMTKIQIARPALSYCGIQLGRSQFSMSHKACWHSTHRGKVSIQHSEGLHQWKYQKCWVNFLGSNKNIWFSQVSPLWESRMIDMVEVQTRALAVIRRLIDPLGKSSEQHKLSDILAKPTRCSARQRHLHSCKKLPLRELSPRPSGQNYRVNCHSIFLWPTYFPPTMTGYKL